MIPFTITQVSPGDLRMMEEVQALCQASGIRLEDHLDYTCAMLDDNGHIMATGSCLGHTLRCIAIHRTFQGEGLLNSLITHLIQIQMDRGISHVFVYTKPHIATFLHSLGFYEIARVQDIVSFMENRKHGFKRYLQSLGSDST